MNHESLRSLASAKICRGISPSNAAFLCELFRFTNSLPAYDFVIQFICANLPLLLTDGGTSDKPFIKCLDELDIAAIQWWLISLRHSATDISVPSDVIRSESLVKALRIVSTDKFSDLLIWWKAMTEVATTEYESNTFHSSKLSPLFTENNSTIQDNRKSINAISPISKLISTSHAYEFPQSLSFGEFCLDRSDIFDCAQHVHERDSEFPAWDGIRAQHVHESDSEFPAWDEIRAKERGSIKFSVEDDLNIILTRGRFSEFERLLKNIRNARKRLRKRQKAEIGNIIPQQANNVDMINRRSIDIVDSVTSEIEILYRFLIARLKAEYNIEENQVDSYLEKVHRRKYPSELKPTSIQSSDAPLHVPTDSSLHVPTDAFLHVPTDGSLHIPTDASLQVPTDGSLQVSTDGSLHVPFDIPPQVPSGNPSHSTSSPQSRDDGLPSTVDFNNSSFKLDTSQHISHSPQLTIPVHLSCSQISDHLLPTGSDPVKKRARVKPVIRTKTSRTVVISGGGLSCVIPPKPVPKPQPSEPKPKAAPFSWKGKQTHRSALGHQGRRAVVKGL